MTLFVLGVSRVISVSVLLLSSVASLFIYRSASCLHWQGKQLFSLLVNTYIDKVTPFVKCLPITHLRARVEPPSEHPWQQSVLILLTKGIHYYYVILGFYNVLSFFYLSFILILCICVQNIFFIYLAFGYFHFFVFFHSFYLFWFVRDVCLYMSCFTACRTVLVIMIAFGSRVEWWD